MPREDLRIRKTRAAIHEAFLLLLQKKKLEKISVKELCETAMIGKGTFYLHYTDIYDLYRQELLLIFSRTLDELGDAGLLVTAPEQFFHRFGQVTQAKRSDLRRLLQGGTETAYIREFSVMICERVFASGALPRTEETEMRLMVIVLSMLYLMPNYETSAVPFEHSSAVLLIREMLEKLL